MEIEREGEPIVNVLDGPFVRLHGRPSFAGTGPGGFRNSARPLLFCTLLRTGNGLFPRSQA